jgi:hypothetical protein
MMRKGNLEKRQIHSLFSLTGVWMQNHDGRVQDGKVEEGDGWWVSFERSLLPFHLFLFSFSSKYRKQQGKKRGETLTQWTAR